MEIKTTIDKGDNEIFALDVGTRSVIGIIVKKIEGNYELVDYEILEHEGRAMYDGQIHNINEVQKIVNRIRISLEERNNIKLKKVAIAAAGRALHTIISEYEKDMSVFYEINEDDVKELEWETIRKALNALEKNYSNINKQWNYHCVGYSVINYKLEDQVIGNLVGQKGNTISAEIVATFLPRVVVDSLLTVIKKANLELYSLTLEPIAASYLAIPQNMRKLNIALVDIGAGTSDIAVTKDGTIKSYGMVPIAGDEITEKLCEEFLVDFDTGERIKRKLKEQIEIEFTDILGSSQKKSREEIIKGIDEAVTILAHNIALKIMDINGKLPHAVICIGGGSLTPGLTTKLAGNLGLPENRVAVRGKDIFSSISNIKEDFAQPYTVTPLGIAISAIERGSLNLLKVEINDIEIQLFEFGQPNVSEALIQQGISPSEILGKPGMALTFELNNELKIIKGKTGKPAIIQVNGQEKDLTTSLKNNDKIYFKPGQKGEDARGIVSDYIDNEHYMKVTVNNKEIKLTPEVYMNGEKVDHKTPIKDGCKITFEHKNLILSDVLSDISIDYRKAYGKLVTKINGEDASFTSPVKHLDRIDIYWSEST